MCGTVTSQSGNEGWQVIGTDSTRYKINHHFVCTAYCHSNENVCNSYFQCEVAQTFFFNFPLAKKKKFQLVKWHESLTCLKLAGLDLKLKWLVTTLLLSSSLLNRPGSDLKCFLQLKGFACSVYKYFVSLSLSFVCCSSVIVLTPWKILWPSWPSSRDLRHLLQLLNSLPMLAESIWLNMVSWMSLWCHTVMGAKLMFTWFIEINDLSEY